MLLLAGVINLFSRKIVSGNSMIYVLLNSAICFSISEKRTEKIDQFGRKFVPSFEAVKRVEAETLFQ